MCTFLSALDTPLSRADELLAKTNQLDLATRRTTAAEIAEFATRDGRAGYRGFGCEIALEMLILRTCTRAKCRRWVPHRFVSAVLPGDRKGNRDHNVKQYH